MVHLYECMEHIRKLVKEKGHEDTLEAFPLKCLFAIVEISEAVDEWKKNEFKNKDHIVEELIDAIFYILDAYGLLVRDLNVELPDKVFWDKLKKNFKRRYRYGRPVNDLYYDVPVTC